MRIEYLERLDIRRDHRNYATLLLALELSRTEYSERSEYLITQHGQKPERDIVISVLL